jgi:energy-coupling factor transport system substrate-specific component
MFGGITGSGADFFTAYMLALGNDLFGSVVVMVFTSNLLDKVVTALIAWGVVKAMPERTTARFPGVQSVS